MRVRDAQPIGWAASVVGSKRVERPYRRQLPPLNALRAFEAVARSLSFTKAADQLLVTQSAVSRQVKNLEDILGVALLKRKGALELTEEGIRDCCLFLPKALTEWRRSSPAFVRRMPSAASF